MCPLRPRFFLLSTILILSGCGARLDLAPVSESKSPLFSASQKKYVVHSGDTLYAIAFGFDTDFRQLALLNHLNPPYKLSVGQVLSLQKSVTKPRYLSSPKLNASRDYSNKAPYTQVVIPHYSSGWYWPVKGRVVTTFIPNQGKKGINIACKKGDKVHASSAGIVAYAGSGLVGYGNLIIIKHNNEYLTAYGNNNKNLVYEGQRVSTGQIIAEVGLIQRSYWGSHFEIRQKGVPVNPLTYLEP